MVDIALRRIDATGRYRSALLALLIAWSAGPAFSQGLSDGRLSEDSRSAFALDNLFRKKPPERKKALAPLPAQPFGAEMGATNLPPKPMRQIDRPVGSVLGGRAP